MSNPHIYDRAFPVSFENGDGSVTTTLGLTKREYFAGLAMQPVISTNAYLPKMPPTQIPTWAARLAVEFADALIAELAKTEGGAA